MPTNRLARATGVLLATAVALVASAPGAAPAPAPVQVETHEAQLPLERDPDVLACPSQTIQIQRSAEYRVSGDLMIQPI